MAFNRVRIVHPDGSYFTYEHDGLDRPTLVRENGGAPIAAFAYDNAGRRASSGWTATTAYAYDSVGRLQTLSHNLAGTSRDHILGFTYNPASQIHSRSASNDAYAWTGTYNTVRPYAANGLNQYTAAGPAAFAHDDNGNLASTANGPASASYVYDIENRLVSATGAQAAELLYDPLGRLFQVSSGGAVRRLAYEGDALVAEYNSAGAMAHRYVHGNDPGADDPLVWYDNLASGWRRALLADHQGSVIQVADLYGNPVATNSYDPWGLPAGTPAGRFGYTGQTWVPELGLWYYKARFYSPTTGRFLQVDPIGYDDGMNLYAYVGNDPINDIDPTGTARCDGDPRCGQVHQAADDARARLQVASGELRSLASVMKGGLALSTSQQSLLGAFEKKFGGSSDGLLHHVAGKLDGIAEKIGARGSGVNIEFGPAKGNALATAMRGGDSITIRPLFFTSTSGISHTSIILHEGGHSFGLRDKAMPSDAPPNLGRESLGKMRAYGVSATDWLGVNDPRRARKNNDSYHCFVIPACGGP